MHFFNLKKRENIICTFLYQCHLSTKEDKSGNFSEHKVSVSINYQRAQFISDHNLWASTIYERAQFMSEQIISQHKLWASTIYQQAQIMGEHKLSVSTIYQRAQIISEHKLLVRGRIHLNQQSACVGPNHVVNSISDGLSLTQYYLNILVHPSHPGLFPLILSGYFTCNTGIGCG